VTFMSTTHMQTALVPVDSQELRSLRCEAAAVPRLAEQVHGMHHEMTALRHELHEEQAAYKHSAGIQFKAEHYAAMQLACTFGTTAEMALQAADETPATDLVATLRAALTDLVESASQLDEVHLAQLVQHGPYCFRCGHSQDDQPYCSICGRCLEHARSSDTSVTSCTMPAHMPEQAPNPHVMPDDPTHDLPLRADADRMSSRVLLSSPRSSDAHRTSDGQHAAVSDPELHSPTHASRGRSYTPRSTETSHQRNSRKLTCNRYSVSRQIRDV
jgi:hypothetical protein